MPGPLSGAGRNLSDGSHLSSSPPFLPSTHRPASREPEPSCLPLSRHAWLKTLLCGLRHKGPEWIKLLGLRFFPWQEIPENKMPPWCFFFFFLIIIVIFCYCFLFLFLTHSSAQMCLLVLNKGDMRMTGSGLWAPYSTFLSPLLTKWKEAPAVELVCISVGGRFFVHLHLNAQRGQSCPCPTCVFLLPPVTCIKDGWFSHHSCPGNVNLMWLSQL